MAIASWPRPSARATTLARSITRNRRLCSIPFRAASKWNKQTKGMLGNLHDPIERARDAAKTLE